jgi:hypothetical protein
MKRYEHDAYTRYNLCDPVRDYSADGQAEYAKALASFEAKNRGDREPDPIRAILVAVVPDDDPDRDATVYPVCSNARTFARIAGFETFHADNLRRIIELGYAVYDRNGGKDQTALGMILERPWADPQGEEHGQECPTWIDHASRCTCTE